MAVIKLEITVSKDLPLRFSFRYVCRFKGDRVTLKGNGEALKGDKYAFKGNKDILKAFNCNNKYSRATKMHKDNSLKSDGVHP